MIKVKSVLDFIAKSSIFSLVIVFIDFIIFSIFAAESNTINSSFSLIVLLEGGLCLVAAGGAALYSPSISKINEVLFHSKPWSASQQKHVEKQVHVIIGIGAFLVTEAMILSVF